jgi:hypothetical protein
LHGWSGRSIFPVLEHCRLIASAKSFVIVHHVIVGGRRFFRVVDHLPQYRWSAPRLLGNS